MLEPRDFTYLKFTNMSTTNPSGHWELCISKDVDRDAQSTAKLGKLFSISYIIEDKVEEGVRLRVRTYTSLDIAVPVDKIWERLMNELKAYIEELWEEAQGSYS